MSQKTKTQEIALKSLLALGFIFLALSSPTHAEGKFTVKSVIVNPEADGSPVTTINLSVIQINADYSPEYSVDLAVHERGTLAGSTKEAIVTNKAKNIIAINIRPATHTCYAWIAMVNTDGKLYLFPSIAKDIKRLLLKRKKLNLYYDDLSVSGINSNVLTLDSEGTKNLIEIKVQLTGSGRMRIKSIKDLGS